jgi:hypothetical protein
MSVSPHPKTPLGVSSRVETGAEIVYYIVRKIKGRYYLIKVVFDPIEGRKRQVSLGNAEEIERIIRWYRIYYKPSIPKKRKRKHVTASPSGLWCGGWDSNPRRPTPSGPKPDLFDLARAL